MGLLLRRCLALAACRLPSLPEEPPAAPVTPEEKIAQEQPYEDLAARLAPEGAAALAGLSSAPDPAHGAVFYQGRAPATGSTAYLRLVQLGSGGGGTLRLVIRYQGPDWLEVDRASIAVAGRTVGDFIPQKIRAERSDDGVVQIFDADADLLRPALTALLEAEAAEITLRGPRGEAVIRLNESQLAEMRQVFAASLDLSDPDATP